MAMINVAAVCLFSGLDRELSYEIDDKLLPLVKVGSMVKAPLRNSSVCAIVKRIEKVDEKSLTYRLKKIYALVQPEPVLTPELVGLAEWIKSYYCASMQSVLETMIPSVVRAGKGALEAKEVSFVGGLDDDARKALARRAPQQSKIYEYLAENGEPILESALMKLLKVPAQSVESLAKKGIVKISQKKLMRSAFDDDLGKAEIVRQEPLKLNDEQQKAFGEILADIEKKSFCTMIHQ